MYTYYYSAANNAFIAEGSSLLQENYYQDAIQVSDEIFNEYFQFEREGKRRAGGANGLPFWETIPEPTPEEKKDRVIKEAELKKSGLMAEATSVISPLQDALDLDMATSAEANALTAWKKYRVLLNRVDTTQAPDINWPVSPS